MSEEVKVTGPLFRGLLPAEVRNFESAATREVANVGLTMLRDELHHVLQHPTGYYESHTRVVPQDTFHKVTDTGIVYGPWLEGTGSRNKTTRFKGYHHFRRVSQKLQEKAVDITLRVLPEYIRRLNG